MIYSQIDLKTIGDDVLKQLSTWHNLTPALWIKNYQPTAEDIASTVKRMKDNDCYLGIASEDTIVGFIWAEKHDDHVMILSLYIEERVRNQNIATELKAHLETWCLSEGIKKIKTTVHSKNKKMLALNEKLGYEAKMVHMEKQL